MEGLNKNVKTMKRWWRAEIKIRNVMTLLGSASFLETFFIQRFVYKF